MPHRLNDARHRGGQQPTSRPHHLFAGLALPTAAAIVLMFIAAGTAVATTRPATLMHNAAALTAQPAVVESAAARASRLRTFENTRAVALAQSAAQATAVAQAKAVVQAKAVERGQGVARAKAVARGQAVSRVKAVAQKLSVTRGNQRMALAARATVTRPATSGHSWRLPISNPVKTSGFGYRWGRLHAGEDFAVSVGTPLRSMSTGTVSFAGVQSGYGNIVQIRYWDGTVSYYGHMSSISVRNGQAVSSGQIVGGSGNTGHSTGPHLHLEIHPGGGAAIDPLPWLAAHHIAT